MGRSVDYVTDAEAIVYRDVSEFEDHSDWDWFVEGLQESLSYHWKSFDTADSWMGNELHVIAESDFAKVVISEYCGLASISLVSKGDDLRGSFYGEDQSMANLADRWTRSIAPKFEKLFGEYEKIAVASNGEAFYERV